MKKVFIYGFWISVLAVVILSGEVKRLNRERIRLAANQEVLLSDVAYYRTADSLHAAGVNRLTLTNREFREYCGELERTVESLNLKVRRLQAVSRTATSAKYPVRTVVRDSIIPGRVDTLRCIDFRNDYLTLSGCVENRQFTGLIQSRDTLIQVIHRVPRRFWFIRWGTKAIRQEMVSRNPYSRIVYTEYIELKRR